MLIYIFIYTKYLLRYKCYIYIYIYVAKSLQSCPTLCDPVDSSRPDSPIPGILQARTLEWVAISFSNEWKWRVKVKSLSRVRLSATPWTAAHQAPPSMGFSRQEYWSGVPSPSLILWLSSCMSWIHIIYTTERENNTQMTKYTYTHIYRDWKF